MTILITGATGNMGSEVVQHLLKRNVPIRGLVRDPNRATKLTQQGIELAIGDLAQPETLVAALKGVEKAFLVLPNLPNQVDLECAFIDHAKQVGVQQIVKLSVMRAGEVASTFQKWHRQVEEHLEQSGIAWTHLRPNMFMQNMRWFAQTIAQNDEFYNCVGDARISHVDSRDVSAVAAACLTEAGYDHKAYVLTGTKAITFAEVADILSKAMGKPIKYVDLPPQDLKAARLANGEPEWYLDAELELCAAWKQGAGSEITNTIEEITHRQATSYETFAQYYAQSHT